MIAKETIEELRRAAAGGDTVARLALADVLEEQGKGHEAARLRMSPRNAYYIHYPRDFANEYTVYVVPLCQVERFEWLFPDAERIARQRAINRGWTRPREAKRDGEQWFAGFAEPRCGDCYPRNAEEAIREAREATLDEMDIREGEEETKEAMRAGGW